MPALLVNPNKIDVSWDRTGSLPTMSVVNLSTLLSGTEISLTAEISFESTAILWLSIIQNSYTQVLPVLENEVADLPNGTYKATTYFTLTDDVGNTAKGNLIINLTLTGSAGIKTDKPVYNVLFNRLSNTLSGDTVVGITNNGSATPLRFWQNGNIFDAASGFTTTFSLLENNTLPLLTNPAVPNTGVVSIPAKIEKTTGEFVTGFTIILTVIDGGISVTPESLYFEIFKGPGSDKSTVLAVTNPLGVNFEITAWPSWLTLDSLTGNVTKNITATTSTSALAVGSYTGSIKFEYNSKSIIIPVTLDVKAFVFIDETIDFCLDLPEVKVSKHVPDAAIVRMTISATYTVLGITTNFQKIYSQNYFQDQVLFGLGEKLHRHFPRMKKYFFDDDQVILMEQINASIKVEELDVNRVLLFDQTIPDIKLFPGKKPSGYPFLTNTVFRKKNDKAIIFSSTVTGSSITLNKIKEADLPNPLIAGSTLIRFYDFPKVFQPVHVQWENQNLVPEWFTMTGDFAITPEFNHIYARNIFNAQNEKYDVSTVKTLNISSGLIMGTERPLIKEMIESKLSFIKIGEKIYRCFNITKKMTLQDSQEELLSNDFEFLIVEQ